MALPEYVQRSSHEVARRPDLNVIDNFRQPVVEQNPPIASIPVYEVIEGTLEDDLLTADIYRDGAWTARAELGFYLDGEIVDIENFKTLAPKDNDVAFGSYEKLVDRLAGNGFIEQIEITPGDPETLKLAVRTLIPDGWERTLVIGSRRRENYRYPSTTASLSYALDALVADVNVTVLTEKTPPDKNIQ